MFEIREITKADSLGLIQLWRTTWTATYGPSLGADVLTRMLADLDENGITSMLPEKGERGFCIASDDCILGSTIIMERGSVAYLWGLYILPNHQRCGLGSRLLARALSEVRPAKTVEVRVLPSSEVALAFYRKHGFNELGRETTELLAEISAELIVMSADAASLNSAFQRC